MDRARLIEKELCDVIVSLRSGREAAEFIQCLLTPSERRKVAERWQVVKRLVKGETHREVRDALKVGIATVSRGARELKYGNGAFQKIYRKFEATSSFWSG